MTTSTIHPDIASSALDLLTSHNADDTDRDFPSFDDCLDDLMTMIIAHPDDIDLDAAIALCTLARLLADARDDESIYPAIRDTIRDNTPLTILD